jgi:hypothetical protein
MRQTTSLTVSYRTRDKLKSVGKFGESYDSLINRLIDERVSEPTEEYRSQTSQEETGDTHNGAGTC